MLSYCFVLFCFFCWVLRGVFVWRKGCCWEKWIIVWGVFLERFLYFFFWFFGFDDDLFLFLIFIYIEVYIYRVSFIFCIFNKIGDMVLRVLVDDFECRVVWWLYCVYGYFVLFRVWEVKVEWLVWVIFWFCYVVVN